MEEKIIKIKIGNVKSRIFGFLPDNILDELYEKLSFKKAGIEYSPKVIDGKWDGFKRLFDRYNKTFQTGLISLVNGILKKHHYKIEIDDQRTKPTPNFQWQLVLPENVKSLYDFQQEAVYLAKKASRGTFSIATGGGKTLTFAAIIAELKVAPVIVYVPSLLLLYQTKEEIERFIRDKNGKNIEVGIVGDGKCEIKDITIMTIQTAITAFDMEYDKNKDKIIFLTPEQIKKKSEQLNKKKRVNAEDPDSTEDLSFVVTRKEVLQDLIKNAKMIITDESHRASSSIYQEVLKQSPLAYYRFAFSVHPNSIVEVKGEMFGAGKICSIEDVFLIINKEINSFSCNGYEIIDVSNFNIYSRSFNNNKITWNKIKKVIRHFYNDHMYNIQVAGNTISVTGEHSLFTIEDNQLTVKNVNEINKNDIMLYDIGDDYSMEEDSNIIDMFDVIEKTFEDKCKKRVRVACNLNNITKEELLYNHKIWWQCCNRSKYGSNIPMSKYLELENKIGEAKFIYLESANNNTIQRFINLTDLSYLFGYFLGDGWVSGNTLYFAVAEKDLSHFLNYLNEVNIFHANVKVVKAAGKSYEVKISHKLLAKLFLYVFGDVKFHNKNIPSYMIYNWSKNKRIELLNGLIDSDGNYSKNKNCFSYSTCSSNLSNSIRALLRSLGHTSNVFVRKPCGGGWIKGRQIIGTHNNYYIQWAATENGGNGEKKYQRENKSIHAINSYVRKIEKTEDIFNGYVYDFEMEEHPSFTVDGILVHNSATNFREDNTEMLIQAIFGKQLLHISCSELIRRPDVRIVRPYIFMVEVPNLDKRDFSTYAQIRKNCIVMSDIRNELIANITENIKQYGPTLLLVGIIEHGKILEKMIPGSVFISGKMPKKKKQKALEDLMSGELNVLIASPIIDEGLNLPGLKVLLLCDGGKAATKLYQRVGRVVREYTNKNYGIVIDFKDKNKMLLEHAGMREKLYLAEDEWVLTQVSANNYKSMKGV